MKSAIIRPSKENLIKELDDCKDNLIEESFFTKTPERKRKVAGNNSESVEISIFDNWRLKHKKIIDLPAKTEKNDTKDTRVIVVIVYAMIFLYLISF